MIEIIAIGRKLDSSIKPLIDEYENRLRPPFKIKWTLLPYSRLSGIEARYEESKRILEKLNSDSYVILLDEDGRNVSSEQITDHLERVQSESRLKVVFVVGGAYGVDQAMKDRANFIWSLSKLVFPHRLVHLILTEQIYRAQEIRKGGSYHHN